MGTDARAIIRCALGISKITVFYDHQNGLLSVCIHPYTFKTNLSDSALVRGLTVALPGEAIQ